MNGVDRKVEDILTEAGLLNGEMLESIHRMGLAEDKEIEGFLLSGEVIKYREILRTMALKMGVGFVDLENVKVNSKATELLDRTVARKYSVFPFDVKDNLLYLAMQNPNDIFLTDEIKVYAEMEIKPFLADFRLISKAIDYFYPVDCGESRVNAENTADHEQIALSENPAMPDTNPQDAAISMQIDEILLPALKRYLVCENISDIRLDHTDRMLTITLKARY